MTHESFILSKDASLEASIATMQEKLADLGFNIEERSWLNPVANAWSVHIRDRECALLFTNGKGATELAARASALGEFFERLGCNYFWSHYYLGETLSQREFVHYPQERWFPIPADETWPSALLDATLHAYYNPDDSVPASALIDRNSGNAARGICALPYQRQRDATSCWFPVGLIGNLYVSNGMSAGNTAAEARVQALSEILERHIKFRIIREGLCLPDVPPEVIARYPKIAAGIDDLRAAGFSILVKDASLGGRYPVMNVTLLNPNDQGCFASFGAHPRFEVALERALTELLQGRALDALGEFPEPSFDLDEIAEAQNLEIHFVDSSGILSWEFLRAAPDFAFADWDFGGTTGAEFTWLCDTIHADGYDIYIADFPHLGVYTCRILVPGMSEIYPIDDLEWNNNNIGNTLHPQLLNLSQQDDDALRTLLDTLNVLGLEEQRPVPELLGLAEDAWSLWHDLRVAELKLLIALAIQDLDAVQEGCQWARQFDQIDPERRQVYRCIETLLQMEDVAPYHDSLRGLYGHGALTTAQAMLRGEERFFGLDAPGMDLAGCVMHQRLLKAYRKRTFTFT
jgi:ribosomal protein S12 methylthiotransferase accessory factor